MQKNQYGVFLIVALVALRVGIGMHFFREGVNKLRDPQPFSAGFFANATGPFAGPFHNLVWDRDGSARLDLELTIDAWDEFRARVERQYGFDENQKKQAGEVVKRYEKQLREYFDDRKDEIREYRGNLERHRRYVAERQRMETPSLREQVDRIEADVRTKRTGIVAGIDALWEGIAADMNALATSDQRANGPVKLPKLGRRTIDSESVDRFIPWFDVTIGALLVLGLATRPAAFAGAAFLFSVLLSQWPLSPDSVPTWPQFIEALGLLVVAAAGAGRYAGLDALFPANCCRPKRPDRRGT